MLSTFSGPPLFRADNLSWVMAALTAFVVANVLSYSRRYLAGDRGRRRHRRDVLLLAACLAAMAFADHLLVLLAAWVAADLVLVRLMIHNGDWEAARESGRLALRTLLPGGVLLAGGFWILADAAGTAAIHEINAGAASGSAAAPIGLALIALAALIQSASWPFHRWLTSSLNSPTPVSALMHAGLVNGGGFLLVRFAPLYLAQPAMLHALFLAGLVTAVVGTFWKLVQTDVKRMLACSTMGQMGFMLMQCGMGLFAPAASHLCWHGLFKAYLFLGTGSVVREERKPTALAGLPIAGLPAAGLAGVLGASSFAATSGLGFRPAETSFVMVGLAFMAAVQVAGGLLAGRAAAGRLLAASAAGLAACGLYGLNVRVIETVLAPLESSRPQPLDPLYAAGFAALLLVWLALNLDLAARWKASTAWKRLYVAALNGGQPHPRTVTVHRTTYRY